MSTGADASGRKTPTGVLDLVVTTIGRPAELRRLLASIERQGVHGLRVLLADQSGTEEIAAIAESFANRLAIHRLVSRRGASTGRNAALALVQAPIIAFPDDDCWYPDGFLAQALGWLDAHPAYDGLLTRWEDPLGEVGGTRWDAAAGPVDRHNIWTRGNTASTFLRLPVVKAVGDFDVTIGVGSEGPWQSGEETDYLIRALDLGFGIHYQPSMALYHPDKLRYLPPRDVVGRGRAYARGMGRVLRLRGYGPAFAGMWIGRALVGAARAVALGRRQRAAYYWALVLGRLEGWLGVTFS